MSAPVDWEAVGPELAKALNNSLATIAAVYQWIDKVEAAGGATCISGIAACNAMLKSMNGQRARLDKLIMEPANAALAKTRVS